MLAPDYKKIIWEIPEALKKRAKCYVESPDQNLLAAPADIYEERMGDDYSKLLLFKNKENPKLIFESEDWCTGNTYGYLTFSSDSKYLWFSSKNYITNKTTNEDIRVFPFFIIRLPDLSVAIYDFNITSGWFSYEILEIEPLKFYLKTKKRILDDTGPLPRDGEPIDFNSLKWIKLSPKENLSKLFDKEYAQRTLAQEQ